MPATGPVLCFGELLWDVLPHGTFPGGAPLNVAYHLHRCGVAALPVSAVGADARGEELLARLVCWGISTTAITCHPTSRTGEVTAVLGPSGDARYTIATDVAWDRIACEEVAMAAARTASAVVFGSLALRSAGNRDALDGLLAALTPSAWRVFDVNLRAPHDDLALVRRYAAAASLLKVNAAEAARLARDGAESPGAEEGDARALAAETGAALICVTSGARGAGVLRDGRWTWEPARPIVVADTVGAGDAFLAALLAGLLRGEGTAADLLAAACRRGEWVASQRGATPSEPA